MRLDLLPDAAVSPSAVVVCWSVWLVCNEQCRSVGRVLPARLAVLHACRFR